MRIVVASFFVFFATSIGFAQNQNDIIIESDASFALTIGISSWFKSSNCPASEKGVFHFQVGKQTFAVSAKEVTRGRLSKVAKTTVDQATKKLRIPLPKTAGCKSNPLAFFEIELETRTKGLPPRIVLVETVERSGPKSDVLRYIEHLNSTKACRETKERNLILCAGSRDRGKVNVIFMIITDDRKAIQVPASGVPIHARCEDPTGDMQCVVNEELPGNVLAKAWIDRATLTADNITSLSQRLTRFASERRILQSR